MIQTIFYSIFFVHAIWQVYGNFIYFEKRGSVSEQDQYNECMEEHNILINLSMLVPLLFGYILAFVSFILIIVTIFESLTNLLEQISKKDKTSLVLKSLSRQKFSKITSLNSNEKITEKECAICMEIFKDEDDVS